MDYTDLVERLRYAAAQHPLDAPMELFEEAAKAIEILAAENAEKEWPRTDYA